MNPPTPLQVICTLVVSVPLAYIISSYLRRPSPRPPQGQGHVNANANQNRNRPSTPGNDEKKEQKVKSIMQPSNPDLAVPKEDPFTLSDLKRFDGREGEKVYVAIKGTVFDVTRKKEMYGPGGSYHVFAGKDGSRGLGMSSLKPEDAVPDYSGLDEPERKVLDDWYSFFSKRYNIVGKVVQNEDEKMEGEEEVVSAPAAA